MTVRTLSEVRLGETLSLDPRGTGKVLVRIIDEGEGSSAIYTREALQRAVGRHFAAGTHMYLDHAPDSRRGVHGERSVRDLASVLTTDAYYSDDGALVAEAQALPGYEATLEALAPHVGLSISAVAEVDPPTTPGGKPIVSQFLAVESVDWVVKAGRGGKVMAILESAGMPTIEATANERRDQLSAAVRAAYASGPDEYAWVRDFDDTAVVFELADKLYSQPYTVTDDDLTVTLTGQRTEVRAVTQYVPAHSAGVATTESPKEELMPEITQAELDALNTRATDAEKRAETAEAALAEAEKAKRTTEARKAAAAKVAEAAKDLPDSMVARITATVEAQVGETLPDDIDQTVTAAVEAERQYLASITESSRLTGFGATTTTESAPRARRTHNAFGREIKES